MTVLTHKQAIDLFDPGLEHYWLLDESSGDYIDQPGTLDSVAVNAVARGAAPNLVDGEAAGSARTNGTTSYIDFGAAEPSGGVGAGTLNVWVRPLNIGIVARQTIISNSTGDAGPASFWDFTYDLSGDLKFVISENGSNNVTHDIANNSLSAATTYMLTVTADNSGALKFYINAVIVDTGDITVTANGSYDSSSWLGDLAAAVALDSFNMCAREIGTGRENFLWANLQAVSLSETEWSQANITAAYNAGLDCGTPASTGGRAAVLRPFSPLGIGILAPTNPPNRG
jgi:hypothetical protein